MSDTIYAMLLIEEKFQSFTPKPISDATKSSEVLIALALENREQVDDMIAKAVNAGGSTYKEAQIWALCISMVFRI